MPESKSSINLIPESVDKAIENISSPVSKEMGTTFADLWFLVLGGIHEKAECKRLKIQKNIESYKEELNARISSIPDDQLREPSVQIVGQALEKSKYCIEEPELREMFVNLISRSMDNRTFSKAHPSFAEIITQMSPLDAQNLTLFKECRSLPIAEYRYITVDNNYYSISTHVFLSNPSCLNIEAQSSSIASLERLGLVETSYLDHLTDNAQYAPFFETSYFKKLKLELSKLSPDKSHGNAIKDVSVEKGMVKLTPLGRNFLDVCL